jgi:DNA processing protein
MNINKLTLSSPLFPEQLRHIPQPPQTLYYAGIPLEELLARPRVAIVGSRRVSTYGTHVTIQLARQLAEQGIVIVSGLAIGVDALAHQAAMDVGGLTLAVLPSPLERIAPASNEYLARRILQDRGGLITEYGAGADTYKYNFVERNRLMSGLADVVIVTEAALGSGSLHTAQFALDQGKYIFAVPGNITSKMSAGANNLLKTHAAPATSITDILQVLGMSTAQIRPTKPKGANKTEQLVLDLLSENIMNSDQIINRSGLSVPVYCETITRLEMADKIRALGSDQWGLA